MSQPLLKPAQQAEQRRCCRCRQMLPDASFTPSQLSRSSSRCRECIRAKNRASYAANQERRNAGSKAYYAANRERLQEENRKRYAANRDRYRVKAREANRRWKAEHRDEVRTRDAYRAWVGRLKKHGLTPEDYYARLDAQGGRCALCRSLDPGRAGGTDCRTFALDHCHSTGVVRGLLCHHCNRGLGYFRDQPEVLLAAAEYVRQCCPQNKRSAASRAA